MNDKQRAAEAAPAAGSVRCSGCGRNLEVKPGLAGKKVKCPHCAAVVRLPEAGPAQLPPSPAGRRWVLLAVCALAVLAGVGGAAAGVLVVLLRGGSGREAAPQESRLGEAAERVRALQTDTIDARPLGVTDRDLAALRGLSNLRRLILDEAAVTDEGMKEVGRVPSLEFLSLVRTPVGDAGLASLGALIGLEELRLDESAVTDAGLAHLRAFPQLRKLSLFRTAVTDAGLVHLQPLFFLEHLSLDGTRVTDRGLRHLAALTNLRYLSAWETNVSDAGVGELRRALPRLRINR